MKENNEKLSTTCPHIEHIVEKIERARDSFIRRKLLEIHLELCEECKDLYNKHQIIEAVIKAHPEALLSKEEIQGLDQTANYDGKKRDIENFQKCVRSIKTKTCKMINK